jgi:hypothetical protein
MGQLAKQVVREHSGAIERTVEMILAFWDGQQFQDQPVRSSALSGQPAATTAAAPAPTS